MTSSSDSTPNGAPEQPALPPTAEQPAVAAPEAVIAAAQPGAPESAPVETAAAAEPADPAPVEVAAAVEQPIDLTPVEVEVVAAAAVADTAEAPAAELTLDAAPAEVAAAVVAHRRRLPRKRVLFAAFSLGLVVSLVASVAGLYAYDQAHEGRIVHGVRVGNVDVSDLDRDAAAARLREAFAVYGQGTVVVSDGVAKENISYADLGRTISVDAVLDQAFAVGRIGNVLDRGVDEVRTAARGMVIDPIVTIDPAAVDAAVAALAVREERAPVDATAIKTATGFTTTQARDGRTLDKAAITAAMTAALTHPDAGAELDLPLVTVPVAAAVSSEDANVARARAAAMAQSLTIVNGTDSWTIAGSTIKAWISFGTVGEAYQPIIDPTGIQAALTPLIKDVARAPRNATFLFSKHGKIAGVIAGQTGRSLDVTGTAAAVQAALEARAGGTGAAAGTVGAIVRTTDPKLTTQVAQQSAPLMKEISSWTTFYISGAHNGFSANISIPAQAISGTVVAPGQVFSFWKSVGEVSLAKGYKLGGAIIGGHSVEGSTIGGGICSTSTTLFNAALRAGFHMGDRKNHYYYIARYPKGLDATVFISGSTQDMTWTNDSPYPVLIKAFTKPGVVTFKLYSVPTGRKVQILSPVVKNYRPSATIITKTTKLPHGVRQQVEYEAAGFDSWVTVIVRDKSGKIIDQRTYVSHYARVYGQILVGE